MNDNETTKRDAHRTRTRAVDMPETCPSCNASLANVPFEGVNCPHCGYDLAERPPHFGAEQWDRITPKHRDRDPEVMMSRTPQPND